MAFRSTRFRAIILLGDGVLISGLYDLDGGVLSYNWSSASSVYTSSIEFDWRVPFYSVIWCIFKRLLFIPVEIVFVRYCILVLKSIIYSILYNSFTRINFFTSTYFKYLSLVDVQNIQMLGKRHKCQSNFLQIKFISLKPLMMN